jgi:predicted ArsR family transcriptional regulator
MSDSRQAVVDALRRADDPLTLSALSEATGLHSNTLREHLDALMAHGIVRRSSAAPTGRGRPAGLYEAVDDPVPARVMEYAGLASALAGVIAAGSRDPASDATAAGERWGADLARTAGAPRRAGAQAARTHLVALLDDLGFAPEPDARAKDTRLTRCPLLRAAREHPDIVCAVHLGIVRGALDEWGSARHDVSLHPFSEPGACLLSMTLRRPTDGDS